MAKRSTSSTSTTKSAATPTAAGNAAVKHKAVKTRLAQTAKTTPTTDTLVWRGTTCRIKHTPDYLSKGWSHLEITVVKPKGALYLWRISGANVNCNDAGAWQTKSALPASAMDTGTGGDTRIVNRMKAALSRLGIRGFNPKLKKAAERLDGLTTPEGEPIPPNTKSELLHDMARRRLVQDQIKEIEATRLAQHARAPEAGSNPMVSLLDRQEPDPGPPQKTRPGLRRHAHRRDGSQIARLGCQLRTHRLTFPKPN